MTFEELCYRQAKAKMKPVVQVGSLEIKGLSMLQVLLHLTRQMSVEGFVPPLRLVLLKILALMGEEPFVDS